MPRNVEELNPLTSSSKISGWNSAKNCLVAGPGVIRSLSEHYHRESPHENFCSSVQEQRGICQVPQPGGRADESSRDQVYNMCADDLGLELSPLIRPATNWGLGMRDPHQAADT